MYFPLRKKTLGVLNISSKGICCFLQKILEQHDLNVSCRSFYISGNDGKGLLVLNKRDIKAEKIILESMDAIGIKTAFICAYDGAPDVDFVYRASLLKRSPWLWGSLTAFIALFVFVGMSGLFWLTFWGSIGWFSSRFIMSRQVSGWISSWRSSFGKN